MKFFYLFCISMVLSSCANQVQDNTEGSTIIEDDGYFEESNSDHSLHDEFSMDQDLTCSGMVENGNGNTETLLYYSGKYEKIFVKNEYVDSLGKKNINYSLMTKNTLYTWTAELDSGYALQLTNEEEQLYLSDLFSNINGKFMFADYLNCSPWEYDSQYFELPKGVQFNDI